MFVGGMGGVSVKFLIKRMRGGLIVHVIFEVSRIFVFLKIIHFNPHSLSFLSYWGFLRWLFYWQAVQTEGGFSFQGCPDKRCFTDFISFFLRYLYPNSLTYATCYFTQFLFPIPGFHSLFLFTDPVHSMMLYFPVSIPCF